MKTMHTLDFIPADTLFCRDGRPLAAGSSFGRGAYWPLPTVLHSAVRSALLRGIGDTPKPLDALHVAVAEASGADYFLTCDDRLSRPYSGPLKILNPVTFVLNLSPS